MIEQIILTKSKRGMNILAKHLPNDFCRQAVNALIECERGIVFILTGFYVKGAGETDGPPGAFFLARSLMLLGFKPIIVTDYFCSGFFNFGNGIETIYAPLPHECASSYFHDMLHEYHPVALISIERCGRNAASRYCNMYGNDITLYTAKLDDLFLLSDENVLKIGIGDGGNEIGMGVLKSVIECDLHFSPCIIKADYLITATVSNWGAYGFLAYLQMKTRENTMPNIIEIESFFDYILSKGAVDGVKGISAKSSDGFGITEDKKILNALKKVIEECLA